MNIALIAHPTFSIPPKKYGGIQREMSDLALGLAEKGHRVYLFAPASSDISHSQITIIPISQKGIAEGETQSIKAILNTIENELSKLVTILDCVNLRWEDREPINICRKLKIPYVVSIACALSQGEQDDIFIEDSIYTAHTPTHAKNLPALPCIVSNYGISSREIRAGFSQKNKLELPEIFCVTIAGIGTRKGQLSAIKIAKRLEIPLVIAGAPSQSDADQAYFKSLQPHIDNSQVIYFGEADEMQKNELFRRARFSIVASGFEDPSFQEPFGRVIAESMMNGCPVLGFKGGGSIVDQVTHKDNGYLFTDIDDAVAGALFVARLDRNEVQEFALTTLNEEQFVNSMLTIFTKTIKTHQAQT